MLSIFTNPKNPLVKANISRPIPSHIHGEPYLMRVPQTPSSAPDPAPIQTSRDSRSRFQKQVKSPRSIGTRYSSSEYEDDTGSWLSSPSLSLSSPAPAPLYIDKNKRSMSKTTMASKGFDNGDNDAISFPTRASSSAHAPIPFTLPSSSSPAAVAAQMQRSTDKDLPPIPRTDALGRGLSKRFAQVPGAYPPVDGTTQREFLHRLVSLPRPSGVRTRTDTRRQGHWLRLGTMRVDPKELKRREKEAEKIRAKTEKDQRKAEKALKKRKAKAKTEGGSADADVEDGYDSWE